VQQHHLHQLLADRMHRRKAGDRLLEDHGDLFATNRSDRLPKWIDTGQINQFAGGTPKFKRAIDKLARRQHRAHDREGRHALAAATLADHAEGCPLWDIEVHAVDSFQGPFVQREVGA
jgi:hypothetical protein